MSDNSARQGVLCALGAYFIWGLAPAYFKLIAQVPANEILAHRILWSVVFMLVLLTLGRRWPQVRQSLRRGKLLLALALTSVLVGSNWLLFIWAVNHHHMLEASLGYFINPLVNVLLGMLFLGERFRRLQWLAGMLAFAGVLVQLWMFGSLPLIALGLALTFALYGLLRKTIGIDAQTGMLIETLWLMPAAAYYLFIVADSPTSHLGANGWHLNLLLASAGVLTTVPLLLFTTAANRLRLSTLGFFQYLGPTLMFLLAVGFYGEALSADKLYTFAFIWLALGVFITDALLTQRRRLSVA
ncbi:EamA-like transporter family protein [Sodalis glossinidius str. 'morsitans']|uniref:Chloramphenicol-sensitive protein RarD n=1 Tax=Sodalis glossinidius (strain morsitans) TaxID=343509 RepID=Q2NQG0_SODGM|nr:EamA family transporter RarD [Sodalis glossinidius]BAE75615.1 chloramphenicol-sensitive protein RarD [Sodalis glossinidius str. 'morsitans']CRL46694.1 EamA-like transporter family protein [Sodalis glossinidius str. 'morsitans']